MLILRCCSRRRGCSWPFPASAQRVGVVTGGVLIRKRAEGAQALPLPATDTLAPLSTPLRGAPRGNLWEPESSHARQAARRCSRGGSAGDTPAGLALLGRGSAVPSRETPLYGGQFDLNVGGPTRLCPLWIGSHLVARRSSSVRPPSFHGSLPGRATQHRSSRQ